MIFLLSSALPEGRVFGLDLQTFISMGIQLLNGIILALALWLILHKPVTAFLKSRSDEIKNKIESSDAAMAKAKALIADYEAKMQSIEKEREGILEEARKTADGERKLIVEAAIGEANEIKKNASRSISEDRKRLREETRLHIIELSSIIAQKYIAENIRSEDMNKIFDEALSQLEVAQWQR